MVNALIGLAIVLFVLLPLAAGIARILIWFSEPW